MALLIVTVLAICLLAYWAAVLVVWLVMASVAVAQAGARYALNRYYKEDQDGRRG